MACDADRFPAKRLTIESSETIQVGNVTAQQIDFSGGNYSGTGLPYKGRTWIAVSKTDVWRLSSAFLTADFDKHKPILDAVGKSLRWEAAPPESEEE